MNDFTLEELQAIHYDLVRNDNPWLCGETIINKIQSMIDNYSVAPCNHKWKASDQKIKLEAPTGEIFDYCPVRIHCKLCGESYFK